MSEVVVVLHNKLGEPRDFDFNEESVNALFPSPHDHRLICRNEDGGLFTIMCAGTQSVQIRAFLAVGNHEEVSYEELNRDFKKIGWVATDATP